MSSRSSSLAFPLLVLTTIGCASAPPPQAEAPAPEPKPEPVATEYVPGPTSDDVQAAIRGKNPEVRQCYIAGTFKDAQLRGTLQVKFTIGKDGKVTGVMPDEGTDIADQELVDCVLGVVAQLEFPGGATIDTDYSYPFHFGHTG